MPLIKLRDGDIALNQPARFSIYREDGRLLLKQGCVVTAEDLLARAYHIGYRQSAAPARSPAARPAANTADDKLPLLFGVARISESGQAKDASAARPALPGLRQKVEFFYLVQPGKPDTIALELVGVLQSEALIVRRTADSCSPALPPGVTFDARLFTGTHLFRFSTRFLLDSTGPLGCLFLKYPATVAQAAVRRHPRVSTAFCARLWSGEYRRPPVEVIVHNVSVTGARVSATEDFLVVGQNARLVMKLATDGCTRPVTVCVQVRNRREEGDRVAYGLEFVRMSDEFRRDIRDFVLASLA